MDLGEVRNQFVLPFLALVHQRVDQGLPVAADHCVQVGGWGQDHHFDDFFPDHPTKGPVLADQIGNQDRVRIKQPVAHPFHIQDGGILQAGKGRELGLDLLGQFFEFQLQPDPFELPGFNFFAVPVFYRFGKLHKDRLVDLLNLAGQPRFRLPQGRGQAEASA